MHQQRCCNRVGFARRYQALREDEESRRVLKQKGIDENDLDALLPQSELDSIGDRFWRRYHVRVPAWLHPSDTLVSRLFREMEKRLLTIHVVWRVKTLLQQKKAVQKKERLSSTVTVSVAGEVEDTEAVTHDVSNYLNLLYTLLLAYVMAGTVALPNAPQTDDKQQDQTAVVRVPMDVVMAYYHRTQLKVQKIPSHLALDWLVEHDEAERTAWCEMFRESSRPLGSVIQDAFNVRASLWEYNAPAVATQTTPRPPAPTSPKPDPQPRADRPANPKGGPKVIKTQLKNGTKLCDLFQKNQCKSKTDCARGKHICGATEKGGRVCGGRHYPGKCTNKKVERK
jgi:hypothetical protein